MLEREVPSMKLSELVYLVVQKTKMLDDRNFTYEAFVNGDFNNDADYSQTIVNAMTPINQTIARLNILNKIQPRFEKIEKLEVINNNVSIKKENISQPIAIIKNIVFMLDNGEYKRLNYRDTTDRIFLVGVPQSIIFKELYIEYYVDFKPFTLNDILPDNDVDLKELGISNTAAAAIIERAYSELLEQISPELANLHRTVAENEINDLPESTTSFNQQTLHAKYRIGD